MQQALLVMAIVAALTAEAPVPSPADAARVLGALQRLEGATVDFLAGKSDDQEIIAQVQNLAHHPASGEFRGVDSQTAKEICDTWQAWQLSRAPGALDNYLGVIERAKDGCRNTIPRPPGRTDVALLTALTTLVQEAQGTGDMELVSAARSDCEWIVERLRDGPVRPECLASLEAALQTVQEYRLTHDRAEIETVRDDLRVKREHCQATGARPDALTRIRVDILDTLSHPAPRCTVHVVPYTHSTRSPMRIGLLSTPVNGEVMPGKYWMYAEKDGRHSKWEAHVIGNGTVRPPAVFISPSMNRP